MDVSELKVDARGAAVGTRDERLGGSERTARRMATLSEDLIDIGNLDLRMNGQPLNRMTLTLWTVMESCFRGPVAMSLWRFQAELRKQAKRARESPEGNETSGAVFRLPSDLEAVENELGGYTLGLPPDFEGDSTTCPLG